MKPQHWRLMGILIVAVAAALLISGCFGGGPTPTATPVPCPDDYESPRDESFAGAKTLQVGTENAQARSFDGPTDADILKVTLLTGIRYIFVTDRLGDRVDTMLELFDAKGNILTANDNDLQEPSRAPASRMEVIVEVSNTYFLRVSNTYEEGGCGPEYGYIVGYVGEQFTPTPTATPTPVPTRTPTPTSWPTATPKLSAQPTVASTPTPNSMSDVTIHGEFWFISDDVGSYIATLWETAVVQIGSLGQRQVVNGPSGQQQWWTWGPYLQCGEAATEGVVCIVGGFLPEGSPNEKTCEHTIKLPHDVLFRVAARYSSSVALIALENGITNPNLVQDGRTVRVPKCGLEGDFFDVPILVGPAVESHWAGTIRRGAKVEILEVQDDGWVKFQPAGGWFLHHTEKSVRKER